jgi:hypothetical protein
MTALRVACHVHSDWSYDGKWRLPSIARLFGSLGYDAVLMAEHDRGFSEDRWQAYREACTAASARGALLVPGMEYSDASNVVHLPVWGAEPFLGEGLSPGDLLPQVAELGASSVFAHPARRNAAEEFDPAWARHLVGVEWWNRKYDGYAPGPETGRALASPTVVPFASMDFHSSRQLAPLAMVLESEQGLSVEGVFGALSARRCRAEVLGVSALRFTHGRGRRAAGAAEATRQLVARRFH